MTTKDHDTPIGSQFTPGPWRTNDHRHDEECIYIEAKHKGVATVFCDGDDVDEPNASLIAAAPQMYQALKRVSALVAQVECYDINRYEAIERIGEAARKALAAADGREGRDHE